MRKATASGFSRGRPGGGYRSALACGRTRRLLYGYVPFALSSSMDKIAIVWIAAELTPWSAAPAISAVTVSYLVPGVVVGLAYAGRLAGVPPERLTLVNSVNKCAFLTASGLLHVAGVLGFPLFLGLLALASLSGSFGRASWQSAIQSTVGERHLWAVNSLFSTVTHAGFTVGPALGGVLIAVFGAGPVLVLGGLCHLGVLAAAGGVGPVRSRTAPAGAAEAPLPKTSPSSGGKPGQRGSATLAWTLVVATGVFYVLYGPMVVQLPLKLFQDFAMSGDEAARSLGYAWSAIGAGSAGAALLLGNRPGLARPGWACLIILGCGLSIVVVGAAPDMGTVIVGLLCGGLVFAPYTTIVQTILQTGLDADRFARLNMYYAAMLNGAQPVGIAVAGAVGVSFGPGPILVGTGLLMAVTAAAAFALTFGKGGEP